MLFKRILKIIAIFIVTVIIGAILIAIGLPKAICTPVLVVLSGMAIKKFVTGDEAVMKEYEKCTDKECEKLIKEMDEEIEKSNMAQELLEECEKMINSEHTDKSTQEENQSGN